MTDAAAPNPSSGGMGFIRTYLLRGDIALAVGIIIILAVLLVPMPPTILDFMLAISITFSVMVLMVALFIRRPLEFQRVSDRATHHHYAASISQSGNDTSYPLQWA